MTINFENFRRKFIHRKNVKRGAYEFEPMKCELGNLRFDFIKKTMKKCTLFPIILKAVDMQI